MARFDLLDDGSRACVLRITPLDLPQTEVEKRFDRHVADVRSRYEDRFVTAVRVEWVPTSAPREYYDLVAASCSSCARLVLTIPVRTFDDVARLSALDVFVTKLVNGVALFRKGVWLVNCFACREARGLSAGRAC